MVVAEPKTCTDGNRLMGINHYNAHQSLSVKIHVASRSRQDLAKKLRLPALLGNDFIFFWNVFCRTWWKTLTHQSWHELVHNGEIWPEKMGSIKKNAKIQKNFLWRHHFVERSCDWRIRFQSTVILLFLFLNRKPLHRINRGAYSYTVPVGGGT